MIWVVIVGCVSLLFALFLLGKQIATISWQLDTILERIKVAESAVQAIKSDTRSIDRELSSRLHLIQLELNQLPSRISN